jgi:hypothetical protein
MAGRLMVKSPTPKRVQGATLFELMLVNIKIPLLVNSKGISENAAKLSSFDS